MLSRFIGYKPMKVKEKCSPTREDDQEAKMEDQGK